MIGQIQGIVVEKNVPHVLIDVQGIGYEIETSMSTFFQLPEINQKIKLFTHLTVREDAHILYGFIDQEERLLFRTLIKINGVGPKLALAILSSIQPHAFVQCIQDGDAASLVRIPGVGKKTAERLVIEMRDKVSEWQLPTAMPAGPLTSQVALMNNAVSEATSALITLGYKPQEASKAINRINHDDSLSSEDLIRLALKNMINEG